ncbi:MAG: hypothetical protein NVS9B4_14000 [Candidatus Acidiferrum sp.]
MPEDGFCLVVRRVGHCHLICLAVANESCKKILTRTAADIFKVTFFSLCFAAQVVLSDVERQCEARSQIGHKRLIGLRRLAAQFMVKMGNAEAQTESFADIEK